MYKLLLFFMLFAWFISLNAANTVITGKAPSYSNKKISFYQLSDPFTLEEQELVSVLVDTAGNFIINVNLSQTAVLYTHLGIFKGFLYAEPDKTYKIALPDFEDKSPADKLNPYFSEIEIRLGILNETEQELNFLIRTFNDTYNPYYKKFMGNSYNKNTPAILDTAIKNITYPFSEIKNQYFINFMKYRVGNLKHQAYMQRAKSISRQYFQQQPVLYDNVAYWDLFNQTYHRYLMFFGRTPVGKKIMNDVNDYKSYSKLFESLGSDSILSNRSLRELVIIKGIYDEFHSDKFSRSALLCILDSLIEQTKIDQHKTYAQNIRNRITRLMVGFTPPAFEIADTSGKIYTLHNFLGKYVYLNFCACSSYACMKEFEDIAKVYDKHKEHIQIITIVCDDRINDMHNFLSKKKYPWLFLHFGSQTNLLKSYDIRAYPTYFLIGPDGTLLMSPAVSPKENFEWKLFEVMRKKGDI